MNKLNAKSASARVAAGLKRRYRAERRFRAYGVAAVGFALICLVLLIGSIFNNGYTAFRQSYIKVDLKIEKAMLEEGDFVAPIRQALQARFPEASGRQDRRELGALISENAGYLLRDRIAADPSLVGSEITHWVLASDVVDMLMKGHTNREMPADLRRLSDKAVGWIDALQAEGRLERRFNREFFVAGDSRQPESAGVLGAAVGSLLTLVVTFLLAFPLGVAAAVYLEEFASRNRWTHLIEVNINNLAAVPSIVFGLLGLGIFLNVFGMPRSSPLIGGVVLALMTLPTIIIAGRAALTSVPPSIREAACGVGASPVQVVLHHVLPLAMPGMMTGTIIGMARALGETAPLLMIGMVAFIVDVPQGFADPASALPVQIYLWSDSPERAFVERTSAAILVLLGVLAVMNALAVVLRRKYERKW